MSTSDAACIVAAVAIFLGAGGAADGKPRTAIAEPEVPESRSARTLSQLRDRDTLLEHEPFATHASAASAVGGELLQELAMLPELVEAFTLQGGTSLDDMIEMLDTYDRWVAHNAIAPTAAARALQQAAEGRGVAVPHGTPEPRRDEVLATLRAIADEIEAARSVLEGVDAALMRIESLEARGSQLTRRVRVLAQEHAEDTSAAPGLHRAPTANLYRALQLEADLLARVAYARTVMGETARRTKHALEHVEKTIACFHDGRSSC